MKRILSTVGFYQLSSKLVPWLMLATMLLLSYGLFAGMFIAPLDYQQQDAVRIMYIHVPCALLSLSVYTIIGVASFIFLVWKIKLADIIAKVSAPIGASFTALALISGALWGKPMWGTWWVWDARLTSELVLFFLYCGYIALRNAMQDNQAAPTACGILAVIGLIDIPIIHYSVEWWQTLHQGASISRLAKPTIDAAMLYPLLSVLAACYCGYALLVCMRARAEILWRERYSSWVRNYLLSGRISN